MFLRDFLLIHDRPINAPLHKWAARLLQTLPPLLEDLRHNSARISMCLNQAALIEALRGNALNAEAICDAHLRWVEQLASKYDSSLYELAIQPWVNKGRLRRLEKKFDHALEHFCLIRDCMLGKPLVLGPCIITQATWKRITENNAAISRTLWNVYVVDSLKSYFSAHDLDGALHFVRRARSSALYEHFLDHLFLEGEIISLINTDRCEEAHALSSSFSSDYLEDRIVFILYEGVSLRDGAKQRIIARELAAFVRATGLDFFPHTSALRYLALLASLLEELGEKQAAVGVYERGYELASAIDDQRFCMHYVNALARLCSMDDRSSWHSRRAHILSECYYAEVLQAEGIDGQPVPVHVFDDLMECTFNALA